MKKTPANFRTFPSSLQTRLLAVLPLLSTGMVGTVTAQTAPPTSSDMSPDQVVELSPFEVTTTRDDGYFSRETLQAGRTATDLKDTPAAVSVLNQQFLQDIASTNILDAEIWAVNVEPTYNPGLSPTGSNHRGPNFSFFSRNYFLWYVNSDSFSAERFEFGRGPNGVLFGDGNIGGLASTMTKQAYLGRKASLNANARVDSWGGYRATADISAPAGDRVALRLNLLHDRGTMWQDNSDYNRDGAHLTGTIKLLPKTVLRFEGEIGEIDRQRYNVSYSDQSSYWDQVTYYDGVTPLSVAAGSGFSRINTNAAYMVDIPGSPGVGYLPWGGNFYRTTGSGIALRDYRRGDLPGGSAVPVMSNREFNNLPVDSRFNLEYATSTFYLEHQFGKDLFAQVAYNNTRSPYESEGNEMAMNQHYVDVNEVLPGGAPNPNFGKVFSENYLQKTLQMNTVEEYRAFVAYRFDTGWWKSNINVLGGSRFDKFDYNQRSLVQTGGVGVHPNLTNIANQYNVRIYWNDPISYEGTPNIPGRTFEWARYRNLIIQRKFIDYGQLVSVNKFFDDRLTAIAGARIDRVHQTQRRRLRDDPVTGQPILGANYIPEGEANARDIVGGKSVIDRENTSVNGSLIYYAVPWIGVYYNYSETFSTPDSGHNLIDGSLPPISQSETNEYGVKFNLIDGKIYADIRYYDSEQTDQLTGTGSATQINRIWNAISGTTDSNLAYRDTQSMVLNGYEFEVTANPSKNLRLMANYALPRDQRNVNALPGLRQYYTEHRAAWEAAAQTNSEVATNLTLIETTLRNNTSFALAQRFTKYRANIYGTYTFTNDGLKGLAVGAGTNFVGPSKIGNGASAFDYFWSDPYFLMSAHLSYSVNVFGKSIRLQLNVKNLLDEDDPVNTSYIGYRERGLTTNPIVYAPNGFRYHDPRQFVLTASMKF